jgi:hypothetical protein
MTQRSPTHEKLGRTIETTYTCDGMAAARLKLIDYEILIQDIQDLHTRDYIQAHRWKCDRLGDTCTVTTTRKTS